MPNSPLPKPASLAPKLRQVRTALGLTQQQMFEQLGETQAARYPGYIGLYELGQREPPLAPDVAAVGTHIVVSRPVRSWPRGVR